MKKLLAALCVFITSGVYAQNAPQKYALVIGNSNYSGISSLRNPVNDANDMEAALSALGFTVEKVLDGSLEQMEDAVLGLRRRLGGSRNTYGFFFYAGHGVQSGGDNYLIPVAANNIRSETQLRDRAVSLQFVLESLGEAGNELNMIVLDACRDNPFGWGRSGSRGLSVVGRAPSGSIVMYATGANSTAADGTGRNGLFTTYLLSNLKTPGLSVFEVFDKTMGDVISITGGGQHPELSLRFAGATSAYLGTSPVAQAPPPMVNPPVIPPVPRNLRAGTPGSSGVTLDWDSAGSGLNYVVYYSTRNNPSGAAVYGGPTTGTSIDINGLDDKTDYYFWISSLDGGMESGRSPAVSIKTPALPKPAPSPQPLKPKREPKPDINNSRLNSIGASVGTSFSAPWVIGTVQGTFAPTRYSFMEAGMDIGLVSGIEGMGYYSFYPFAHYALFVPFSTKTGWYAGAGAGYMFSNYTYKDEKIAENVFAMDVLTGFVIGNVFNVSYTVRTNFASSSNKLSVGYIKRFL